MEVHVFQSAKDGEFKGEGFRYNVRCVSKSNLTEFTESGWKRSLEEIKPARKTKPKAEKADGDEA